jgi:hypothetical protein
MNTRPMTAIEKEAVLEMLAGERAQLLQERHEASDQIDKLAARYRDIGVRLRDIEATRKATVL